MAVGAYTKKRTLASLEQWQPSNVVSRPPTIFKELQNFQDQTKNAEMLKNILITAGINK